MNGLFGKFPHYPDTIFYKALVLLHKLLFKLSIRKIKYEKYLIGTACLFLAAKIEDCPLKLVDLSKHYYELNLSMKHLPLKEFTEQTKLKIEGEICKCESDILKEIGFDLEIELPYKFIRRFQEYPMEDKAELEKIVIVAGRFCNDTFLKPICLYYHPILIAGGCLYMSMLYHQKSLPDFSGKPWYKFLLPEIELPHIQEVTNVIKEMFQLIEKDLMGKKPEKPPAPVETKKQSQSIYYLSLIHI
eukprot:TRINITY_DN11979_c0_g1_i1.p1 TRINITY_DN11979_c0_g1~~TRINITY_DN11979_c0_g1_i1.p1  ORF type:complete len:245 (+),score=38.95 TRINITY_DN11979_c0_g1_i1:253-987(+)